MNADAALSDVRPLGALVRDAMSRQRFLLTLLGAFAAGALMLAIFGLYGVIAMSAQARRRELGVRLALGATPAALSRLVLGEGLRLVGLGVVLGLAAALSLAGASNPCSSALARVTSRCSRPPPRS